MWHTNSDPDNKTVLRPLANPFESNSGLKILTGNLGRAMIKISTIKSGHQHIKLPAKTFDTQDDLVNQFKAGKLNQDFIAVPRFQGPKANGMPELHKLTPVLSALQDQGYHVGLVTDGRMSGASGKIPAAIHLTPECAESGLLLSVQEGGFIEIDARSGKLFLDISDETFASRATGLNLAHITQGASLFSLFRENIGSADSVCYHF